MIAIWYDDLLDRGAKTWRSERTTLQIAKVALPAAAGGIITFSDLIERLIFGVPLRFFLPGYLLIGVFACAYIIHTRQRLTGKLGRSPLRYRFPQELRISAKTFLPAFIAMFGLSAAELRPNIMRGERMVSGIICGAAGEPIARATVAALDQFGQTASGGTEVTDDDGYFYLDLWPLAQPAVELRVSSVECHAARLLIADAVPASLGCPKQDRRLATEKSWFLKC